MVTDGYEASASHSNSHQCATQYLKGTFIIQPEVWYDKSWYDTIRYSTINTVWYDIIWYNTIQLIQYDLLYCPCGEVKANGECISPSKHLLRCHPLKINVIVVIGRSEVGFVIALALACQLLFFSSIPTNTERRSRKTAKKITSLITFGIWPKVHYNLLNNDIVNVLVFVHLPLYTCKHACNNLITGRNTGLYLWKYKNISENRSAQH